MLQNSIPDHPRLCSRKIRCRRWKLLPITFLTCHILHKPGQSISKFLKSDLCHFRYSFNTCSSSLSRFVGLDVRQTSWVLWVQTQRWHTTLMKRNLHPNVAASLSSIRTLVTSWVSHELKLWVQCRVTVWMQTRKRSEDAHDNFASRKKKPISKLFFKYLFATGASTSWFFFFILSPSLPPFPPGSSPSLQAPRWTWAGAGLLPQQLSHLTYCSSICFPVLLELSKHSRQECGSRVYKELEFLEANLATEKVWFALCQRGCLERAKQSSWGVQGKKSQKIKDSCWFHNYLWAEQQKISPKCSFTPL